MALWSIPSGRKDHISIKKMDGIICFMQKVGTEQHHCIAAARSRQLTGPYEGCPDNPIFTHRHLGKHYPVTCVGHGDLVEDHQGNWYMVLLACRPKDGYTLKGRETFLAKVVWEDGWPVVNPGIGHLEVPEPGENCEKEVWFSERSLGTGFAETEKSRKNANAGWNLTYVADAGNLIRAKRNCICGASPAT